MTLRSRGFLAGASIVASLMIGTIGAGANNSVDKAVADTNQWAVAGHDYGNTRYSPLKQINSENVGKLSLVYSFPLASLRSNESSPLVIGDTLYVSTSWGPKYVYAIDAATGARKWTYEPEIPDDVLQFACCDVNSRGVSYADGKLFVGRLDGKLVALDAKTGKELWTTDRRRLQAGLGHHLAAAGRSATRSSPASAAANMAFAARCRRLTSIPASRSGRPSPFRLPASQRSDTWKGDTGAARRRRGLAGRLLRRKDRYGFLGHQQSRSMEYRRSFDRRRQFRQADQPLHRLDAGDRSQHRQDQMAYPGNAGGCLGL